jgi:hypothetical protein
LSFVFHQFEHMACIDAAASQLPLPFNAAGATAHQLLSLFLLASQNFQLHGSDALWTMLEA